MLEEITMVAQQTQTAAPPPPPLQQYEPADVDRRKVDDLIKEEAQRLADAFRPFQRASA